MSNLCNCSDSVLLFIAGERMEHLLKDIGKGHGATKGLSIRQGNIMANRGNSNLHDSSKNKRDEFATRHFDTRKKINADTFGYNAKDELTNSISRSPFSILHSYSYDAFGNIIAQSGPMADNFNHRFSTKYFDSETGLYYYGYRYYKPQIIRWLTEDQIGETGGYNLYLFCLNSPLAAIDALGDVAVTDIPGIMDANKWSVGAALMRHWFSLDAKKPTTPNETIVKMGWVLGFERAKTVYDKIFSEKQYVNQSAKKEIVAMIKRTLKGVDGNFCPLNRPASQVESDYINTRQVGSVFDSPDDLMAALGRFNLRMAVSGYVKGNCAFITRVGVYVRDSYDFVGDQSLGYWNSRTNYAGKNFFKGDKVSNASFRDYAKKTGKGADFIVYSDIKITTLDKAEKVVLSP